MNSVFKDARGVITSVKEIPFEISEIVISKSHAHVLRGLHISPYTKRVMVVVGKIYDFFINLETKECTEVVLGENEYVDVPANHAHAFYVFEETEVLYLLGGKFDANVERRIFWNDPAFSFKLDFPHDNLIMSDNDLDAPVYSSTL